MTLKIATGVVLGCLLIGKQRGCKEHVTSLEKQAYEITTLHCVRVRVCLNRIPRNLM
jgi:hypothetical protein